jgi:hypothetical protein
MGRFRLRMASRTPVVVGPTLTDVTLDRLAWDLNAAPGALLATVSGSNGPVIPIPNDGRVVMGSDGISVLRGLSTWSAGAFSIGFSEAHANSPAPNPHITPAVTATIAVSLLSDAYGSSLYNGAEGSGYDPTGVSALAEPVPSDLRLPTGRERPTLSWAEDDREAMVANKTWTFMAGAEGGFSHVDLIMEGRVASTATMAARTRGPTESYDGNSHIEWGYHFNLKYANLIPGWYRCYGRGIPNDSATMDPVIIGPFLVKVKTNTGVAATDNGYYDDVITLGPTGQDQTDFVAAVNAAGTKALRATGGAPVGLGHEHIRIKPVGNLTWDPVNVGNLFNTYLCMGHLDIKCDAGSSFHVTKATDGGINNTTQFGLDFEGTRWMRGTKLDTARFGTIFAAYSDANHRRAISLCGTEVYNSGGPNQLAGAWCYDAEKTTRVDGGLSGSIPGMRIFEVYWHDMHIGPVAAQQLRNVVVDNSTQDQLRPINQTWNSGYIRWSHWYNVKITGFSLVFPDTPVAALRLTGPSTVTWEAVGNQPDSTQRQIVFKHVGGAETWSTNILASGKPLAGVFTPGTFATPGDTNSTFTPQQANEQYYVPEVAAAINAVAGSLSWMAGVVATSLDNTRRAAVLCSPTHLGINNPSPPVALSATPVDLVTRFDIHGDGYQSAGGVNYNMNIINLQNVRGTGQIMFDDADLAMDVLWANTTLTFPVRNTTGLSRVCGRQSHVRHLHETLVGQTLMLSTPGTVGPIHRDGDSNPDTNGAYKTYGKCAFRNGIYVGLQIEQPANSSYLATLAINDNFLLQDNGETLPTAVGGYGTNHTGNTLAQLLTDVFGGSAPDLTPKAAVLAQLKPQLIPFDLYGTARGAMTACGAVVAATGG